MTPELLGTVVAGAVGALGIVATYLTARLHANKQVELLQMHLAEERKRELRAERRRIYADLIAELTEVEASVDYFHRIRRGFERHSDQPELAGKAAGEVVGEFDDVAHFKKLHNLAAQVLLVCTNDLEEALGPAISDAMRAVASMLAARDGDELERLRASKSDLVTVMLYELRLEGYDKPYRDLLEEFQAQAEVPRMPKAAEPLDET